MTEIGYVVLSDLHFGALNSVLSDVADGAVDPHTPSPALASLLECLGALTQSNAAPPTLVLAGDVLDLALSSDNVAAMVFQRFAQGAFATDRALFADEVLFVPGNHDHHLWETAREMQYVDYLLTLPAGKDLEPAWHTTRMVTASDPQPVSSRLLEALIERATGTHVKVRVVYPNLAVRDGGNRAVVIHHGHFTEPMYTLVSELKDMLFPEQRTAMAQHVWDWEAENFAWIDFFWSTLGRSGQAGEDVGLIYAELANHDRVKQLAGNLVRGLVDKQRGPGWLHTIEATAARPLINMAVGRAAGLERTQRGAVLSPKSRAGAHRYLAGPVLDQLQTELKTVPDDVTFVFGHTHKPFAETWAVPGFANDVRIVNTGGWVVDTPVAEPAHGAAIVLVSNDAQVASIRAYNQAPGGAVAPISVTGDGPWAGELATKLRLDGEPWVSLAHAAAAAVTERNALSDKILHQEHPGSG